MRIFIRDSALVTVKLPNDGLLLCNILLINLFPPFLKLRGHNVVAVDQEGSVIEARAFDTLGDSSAGRHIANFITSLPDHTVVLIAVHGSGNAYVADAADALKSLGATEPLNPGFRGSWVLVGYKGTGKKPDWVRQAWRERYYGPTVVAVKVFE